ncbi:ShlB/FhaC/HecB family hemolysin secretion/activation protein [Arcobacter vandammei]|uniref:ShlB/FhaC/HecB family hemolysin secretion/activation protein n=1 Tax=Arcobacter vandammei TaxID=2782243 RepID=UPI0018DFE344|nr:ShlB/FhaC/HecB family hemolysin secretion/activation protein [Arcobacter vandammei]
MKYILLLIFIFSSSFAQNSSDIINRQIKDLEEKKAFEQRVVDEQQKNSLNFDNELIKIDQDKKEENCIEINKINILGSTIFKNSDFKDLIKPYLNKCNGIKNLSNLRDKISNKYIDKGYVTSRAYFKAEDLTTKKLNIYILEGKIEKIESENINISNLFINHKDKVLNLRDLETIVKQAERLQSQKLDLQLIPSQKEGYTEVKIFNHSLENKLFGNIGINNFGQDKTGKYQIYSNLNYENLFGISDIFSLNLNSTNHALKTNDKTLGTSINYSFPVDRFLFDIYYNYSNYKQINKDNFSSNYQSNGNNYSFGIDSSYKLFHSYKHSIELLLNYENKYTKNYLNDVKLDLQSYNISSLSAGFKHNYKSDTFDYYSKLMVKKGLSGNKDDISKQDIYFTKYLFDLGFNKYFNTANNLKYNFYLRGQYSNNNLFGTEEISMGGVYSVRGFNDEGLYGNKGFYTRNELSQMYQIDSLIISPYLGLDYGYVSNNIYSLGGELYGFVFGSRIYLKNLA